MTVLKLSELADDIEVASQDKYNVVFTVGELKREIIEFCEPHHEADNWYTTKRKTWKPNAQSMIESYIDGQSDEMYEDWDERAMDYISDTLVQNIQSLLDEAFDDSSAQIYWEWDKPVEIDIFPNEKEDK